MVFVDVVAADHGPDMPDERPDEAGSSAWRRPTWLSTRTAATARCATTS